jgi:hypothetical protein
MIYERKNWTVYLLLGISWTSINTANNFPVFLPKFGMIYADSTTTSSFLAFLKEEKSNLVCLFKNCLYKQDY